MAQVVGRSDLRRLFLKESTPEETEEAAGAAAMAEVASLFPYLIVSGVHQVERRRGGWFAAVVTKERKKGQRKVTTPTHHEAKTRVTTALEPLGLLEERIDEIRRHSRKVLGDPEALLELVGIPETVDEAATLFAALRRVERGGAPSSEDEAAVVALIEEYVGEATEKERAPAERSAEDRPDDATDDNVSASTEEAPQTKRCSRCGEDREVTEFSRDRRSKDGRASTCKPCRRAAYREYYKDQKASDEPPTRRSQKTRSANGAGTSELDQDWRQHFADPTLGQLELLRTYLGGVTFDETVKIAREIAGVEAKP